MSIFNKTPRPKVGSSTFNLSHDRKFSMKMGDLVPMLVQEIVPGDEFNVTTQQMLRMMPMVAPVMHEVNVFTHFFFVPNRLTWPKWEEFITGGEDGLNVDIPPTISAMLVEAGDLGDHLGLPLIDEFGNFEKISTLPFEAYHLIYNEYYRDQNLVERQGLFSDFWPDGGNQTMTAVNGAVGNDSYFRIKKRAWQHDYFTSALPFAQKGEAVRIPLINTASQYLDIEFDLDAGYTRAIRQDTGGVSPDGSGVSWPLATDVFNSDGTGTQIAIDNSEQLKVPLQSLDVNAANINDLRKAFKIQEWLELAARGGSRYVEAIKSFFGVTSSDARLQRPEYLGGGMSPVMISEVLQTSETVDSPQGNMAGHGINLGKNHSFKRFFEEHGYIIGIVSVMPKTSYQQGIPRHFSKKDKFDYFWPQFEHIGEQEILGKEIYFNGSQQDRDSVFGYIPRYAEYKYNPSTVHGYFKTNLDFWHMGRIFEARPQLNGNFVSSDPTERIFAVEDPDEDKLIVHMWHNITARRKMSYFGDPSFRI